ASRACFAGPSGTIAAQGGGLKCRGRHGLSSNLCVAIIYRLAATCAINSSSDFGRRDTTGLVVAVAGAGWARSATPVGFCSDAGVIGSAGVAGGPLSIGVSAVATSTGAGVGARSGMSVRVVRSCLVAIGASDR